MYRELPTTASHLRAWVEGLAKAVENGATIAMDMHMCGRGRRSWRLEVDQDAGTDLITTALTDAGVAPDHIYYAEREWRLIAADGSLYAYLFQHALHPETWVANRLICGVIQPKTQGTREEVIAEVAEWSKEPVPELWPN